ncbi:MAG: hypothetical protein JSR33_01395 [Proteobacteria bacterium]|nr:hypothetical protein [Pseudomonadota bacterium]
MKISYLSVEQFESFKDLSCKSIMFMVGYAFSYVHVALIKSLAVTHKSDNKSVSFSEICKESWLTAVNGERAWIKSIQETTDYLRKNNKVLENKEIPFIYTLEEATKNKLLRQRKKKLLLNYHLYYDEECQLMSEQIDKSENFSLAKALDDFVEAKITRNYRSYIDNCRTGKLTCIAHKKKGVPLDFYLLVKTELIKSAVTEMVMFSLVGSNLLPHCFFYQGREDHKDHVTVKSNQLVYKVIAFFCNLDNIFKVVRYSVKPFEEQKKLVLTGRLKADLLARSKSCPVPTRLTDPPGNESFRRKSLDAKTTTRSVTFFPDPEVKTFISHQEEVSEISDDSSPEIVDESSDNQREINRVKKALIKCLVRDTIFTSEAREQVLYDLSRLNEILATPSFDQLKIEGLPQFNKSLPPNAITTICSLIAAQKALPPHLILRWLAILLSDVQKPPKKTDNIKRPTFYENCTGVLSSFCSVFSQLPARFQETAKEVSTHCIIL